MRPFKLFITTVFDSFISIGVTGRVYEIAKQISNNPRWNEHGMTGYDIEEFLTNTLSDTLLDQVDMDPESGEFCCYFKLEKDRNPHVNEMNKVRQWMLAAAREIRDAHLKYINDMYSTDGNVPFSMKWTREAKDKGLCDMVEIKNKI
jgi:hypothetical protein